MATITKTVHVCDVCREEISDEQRLGASCRTYLDHQGETISISVHPLFYREQIDVCLGCVYDALRVATNDFQTIRTPKEKRA